MRRATRYMALCLLSCNIFFGVVQASKLTDMINKQTGQEVSVIKEQQLKQDSNLKLVTIKELKTGFRVLGFTNKHESFFLAITSAFFTSNDDDRNLIISEFNLVNHYNMTFKTQEAVKKAINSLPNDAIINLASTNKNAKKVFYIVSDPMCPHCQDELKRINDRLNEGDVKMIPVGWMGKDSAYKVAEIYSLVKEAKTDSEKIKILQKIYNPQYKAKPRDTKMVEEVVRSLMGEGKVEGTPYIIEEDK
ncbi:disulfide isomerase [Helicobacter muridarum]|uniref:Disulphide isomerase n=2 Tax=Helicobacter muridarum TaxID=216 RepID=A0A377PTU5_9HELI|nr:disulfide isomerase [Helicobacter muridarum]STQ85832.1 disulphide isomerase [Helicobacter muridarum]